MQFLFVDSNVLFQCRPLQDLDWDRFVGKDDVTILFSKAVLAEIDKHKSDGNSRRAKRARNALELINSILEAPDGTKVIREAPARVMIEFAPEVDGDTSATNDDSILFEVAEMTRVRGGQTVGLVTDDTNLKLKAKRSKIRYFAVPDEWRLPPEPDERDKRIRQLEDEIALLKKQTPIFVITLGGNQDIELVVPSYEPLSAETIEQLVETMTTKFPMKTDFALTSSEQLLSTGGTGMFQLHPPPDWEIEKYQNEDYSEWVRALRVKLERFHSVLRCKAAITDIHLRIANDGTVPGEYVHVAVGVSDGLLLIEHERHDKLVEKLYTRPHAPSPPQARRSGPNESGRFREPIVLSPPYMPAMPVRRPRDKFYLKTGDGVDTEWVWACENMRHGMPPQEFSFKVGMNVKAHPSGGQMSVTVSAENLPQAKKEKFRIKVSSAPADTLNAATEWLGLSGGRAVPDAASFFRTLRPREE